MIEYAQTQFRNYGVELYHRYGYKMHPLDFFTYHYRPSQYPEDRPTLEGCDNSQTEYLSALRGKKTNI